MAVMKRTTGGLLQGVKRTFYPQDLKPVILHLEARIGNDPEKRRKLGLDIAKRYSEVTVQPVQKRAPADEIVDLQTNPPRWMK